MFTSIISNTKWCHSVGCPCNFIGTYLFVFVGRCYCHCCLPNLAGCYCQFLLTKVGRWYCHLVVVNLKPLVLVVLWADVIALYHLWQMLCHFRYRVWLIVVTCCLWLMLLSHYCLLFGRCYAMWCATTFCCKRALTCSWLMLLPFVICLLGWCYCLLFLVGWCYCHFCC